MEAKSKIDCTHHSTPPVGQLGKFYSSFQEFQEEGYSIFQQVLRRERDTTDQQYDYDKNRKTADFADDNIFISQVQGVKVNTNMAAPKSFSQLVASEYRYADWIADDPQKSLSPAIRRAIVIQVNTFAIGIARERKSDVFLHVRRAIAIFLGLGRPERSPAPNPEFPMYCPLGLHRSLTNPRFVLDPIALRMKRATDKKHAVERAQQKELDGIDKEAAAIGGGGIDFHVADLKNFREKWAAIFRDYADAVAFGDPKGGCWGD